MSLKVDFQQRLKRYLNVVLTQKGKNMYDLLEIKNWKRNHKLDGIGIEKIWTFPFSSFPFVNESFAIYEK